MKNDRIAKRVYVGECTGSPLVGTPRKRWVDTLKDCLRKKVLDVRQSMRMEEDRNEWREVCEREFMGRSQSDEPQTLTI